MMSSQFQTMRHMKIGKVVVGEREKGYEMVDISHRELPPPPPARLEGMYEVPLSPAPPSQPLPTIPPTAGAEEIMMSFLEISDSTTTGVDSDWTLYNL